MITKKQSKDIRNRFTKHQNVKYLDIGVVTFNRLTYLKRCIWSIIASTSMKNRIFVVDDMSDDGSRDWLKKMQESGRINWVKTTEKLGSANSHNLVISKLESNWIAYFNDDMWVHRWWDLAAFQVIMKNNNCGLVSLYDHPNMKNFELTDFGDHKMVKKTGCGAMLIYKKLFNKAGKFQLPSKRNMGFFATPFCHRVTSTKMQRNRIYSLSPHYVKHMDLPPSKLYSGDELKEYAKYRNKHKKGFGK